MRGSAGLPASPRRYFRTLVRISPSGGGSGALAERHPPAATVALRAMIDFSLGRARSSRYGHAARHLAECARLAAEIDDWEKVEPHEA